MGNANNCGADGENCQGTAFWEACFKSGKSGTHYLVCGDDTFLNIRCPLGGLAATVYMFCGECEQ